MRVVIHDSPTFPGDWPYLMPSLASNEGIIWDMLGDRRILPLSVLEDAWRVEQSRRELARLGRHAEVKPFKGFTRDQTVPLPPDEGMKDRACVTCHSPDHRPDHG